MLQLECCVMLELGSILLRACWPVFFKIGLAQDLRTLRDKWLLI